VYNSIIFNNVKTGSQTDRLTESANRVPSDIFITSLESTNTDRLTENTINSFHEGKKIHSAVTKLSYNIDAGKMRKRVLKRSFSAQMPMADCIQLAVSMNFFYFTFLLTLNYTHFCNVKGHDNLKLIMSIESMRLQREPGISSRLAVRCKRSVLILRTGSAINIR
jgi:hypothetical protein